MRKVISILFLFTCSLHLSAQVDKYAAIYTCTKGSIHFFSSSPLEDIEANSTTAVCVLNTGTKKVYAKIKQNSFVFKDKLMQEHFNENYMETDKFPTSALDMIIAEDIDFTKDGVYSITLKGTLEMHGVKQERSINAKLTIKNGIPIRAAATFEVKLVDHKIKIPKAVILNIAEVIKVDVDFALTKYEKN